MKEKNIKENISIILVNPKISENIGASARAMKTMGLKDMLIINPRCQIDKFAFNLSVGSDDILENSRIFETLPEALREFGTVFATTRKKGKRRHNFITPLEMAEIMKSLCFQSKAAVVFGPEDYGLSNEHLSLCQYMVSIPTDSEFGSLNLSQAVMVICYEIHRLLSVIDKENENDNNEYAEGKEIVNLLGTLEDTMKTIHYPVHKRIRNPVGHIKEIFARAMLRKREVNLLLGLLRHLRYIGSRFWKEKE